MILFDYIYYLFACLYRKSKEARESDTWKIAGAAFVSFTFCTFLTAIAIPVLYRNNIEDYLNSISGIILFILTSIYFYIHYEKRMTFEEVQLRIESLNIKQMVLLRIITFIYLLIAIPGCFFAAIYFGKTGQG